MLRVDPGDGFRSKHLRRVALSAVAPSAASTALLAAFTASVRAVQFQVAELALDHQDAGLYVGLLDRDVGQRLDVQARRDLDDLGRHPLPRRPAAHPAAQVAHGLRLELVQEDERSQLGHASALDQLGELFDDQRPQLLPDGVGQRPSSRIP